MKKWIANLDVLSAVLIILALRSIVEINVAQSLVFIALATYKAYSNWLKNTEKPDLSEEVRKELENMRTVISGVAVKNAVKPVEPKRFF